ncbi:inositol monophosphatase family protein [Sphingomonas solaris]|uniref:Inositol monophosphatase n=1 Tax=Alterirhizorhabdus solaris TaxID=2529389 RepID=A0A558R1I2_9SPHN|nr:inositol monophosphatase family protein [Sphingomonas solaris]TVV73230.1 inositol monophosphatase [Sphingomonas solaris]
MHVLHDPVAALLREVADTIVLPRFRNLLEGDVSEKTPGDPVTIADRESEVALHEALTKMLPGSVVVGEEATAADESVLDRIEDSAVWIVDPIDGTANFAAGRAPFAIMVALVEAGTTVAGWIFDPLAGRLCHATLGRGAWIDGAPVRAAGSGGERLIGGISTLFLPSDRRDAIEARAAGRIDMAPIPRCAGEQYPRIVLGVNDFALFERTLPWDHAPGALFLEEAGGAVRRLDGRPYRVGSRETGMMAAASPAIWDEAASILFGAG